MQRPLISLRLGLVVVVGLTLAMPRGADARVPACGEIPGDLAAVASTRFTAEEQCPCAGATNHGTYVACMADFALGAVTNGTLPPQCKRTVLRAARKSTCGKTGAVTCCRVSASGKQTCRIKSSALKCKPSEGGAATVSALSSCYDACLPACQEVSRADEEIETAVNVALEGVPDPWATGFGLAFTRAAAEMGCTPVPTSATPQTLQLTPCLDEQCPAVRYCGSKNSADDPAGFYPHVGSCLNTACFEHDRCSLMSCVRFDPPCYFTDQSDECDRPFFERCLFCPSLNPLDKITCLIAATLKTNTIFPRTCDADPCPGQACNPSTGMCESTTTTTSTTSTTTTTLPTDCNGLPDGTPCDDGYSCSTNDTCQSGACQAGLTDSTVCNNGAPHDNDPDADCLYHQCDPLRGPANVDARGCVLVPVSETNGSPCGVCDVAPCCCLYGDCSTCP